MSDLATTVRPPILGDRLEPLHALQRAVMGYLLAGDPSADLRAMADVYDFVPEKAPKPYVTWGTAWLAERDTLNGCADRVWFQIDVWSDYRGYGEASAIANEIVRLLHHAVIFIPGWVEIHVLREQTHATRDPDNKIRRLALTFHSPYVSLSATP